MGDHVDSHAWTGDVEGRARTQAPLFPAEARAEIQRALAWGAILGVSVLAFGFVCIQMYRGSW